MTKKKKKTKIDEVNDGLKLLNELVESVTKNAPQIADMAQHLFSSLFGPAAPPQLPPHFYEYKIIPPAAATISPYELFSLKPDAPQEMFKQRYRDLMKIYHPDTGAQNDAMAKRLNAAWETIRKEKGWV
jgi:DnaJ-domain-containing protein 1